MKYIFLSFSLLVLLIPTKGFAQNVSGIIEYGRKQNWVQISSKLPYMTQEEIDRRRLAWGKMNDGPGQTYILYFNPERSLYTYKDEANNNGYSWRQDEYLIIRDYEEKTAHDQLDFLGRTYVIQEDAPRIKWKILNEIKEVAGYLCMKAQTIDPVKGTKIHAWFSDAIAVSGGPEGYYGLPGMILAMDFNDGDVIITANKIELAKEPIELPIPNKIKGKKISRVELEEKTKKYIDETIEGRKNPYRQLRY